MADRKAVNKYIPTDFDPRIHRSINRYRKNRLQPLKRGLPVVRFEMPFSIICANCHRLIKKATRFNATKKVVGNYFTTKILEFSMKCATCKNVVKIRSNPENRTYDVHEGGKKRVEEDESLLLFDSEEKDKRSGKDNILRKLEHKKTNERTFKNKHVPFLVRLKRKRDKYYKDNYEISKQMRKKRKINNSKEDEELEKMKRIDFNLPTVPMEEVEQSRFNNALKIGDPDQFNMKRRINNSNILQQKRKKTKYSNVEKLVKEEMMKKMRNEKKKDSVDGIRGMVMIKKIDNSTSSKPGKIRKKPKKKSSSPLFQKKNEDEKNNSLLSLVSYGISDEEKE